MTEFSPIVERNGPVVPHEVADLRAAVGWDRSEDTQERVLRGSYRYYLVRHEGRLIAFVNAVSDGIADALLVNVIVHPEYQSIGVGRAIVQKAVEDLSADGIQCIQTTFLPELEGFYRKCGFYILGGAIIDNAALAK